MIQTARSFFVGIFFCVFLLSFHGLVQAQDIPVPDTTTETVAGDEDNPYLLTSPTSTPTLSTKPSISPTTSALPMAPVSPAAEGQVLSAPDPNTPQLGTFVPGEPNWRVDAEVTQVGRNAERARQFIYWVVTHPPIYNVPQIAQAWAFTRNVAYVLVVFVIVGLALQLVISSRAIGPTFSGISLGMERLNLLTIILRIVLILAFITFSYIGVRLLVEGSEVLSRFFIEQLGGEDLFNIIYSGANQEENYNFVGYRNFDPLEQDMVHTSMFLVRLTSFTYNFMSVIIILRQIVLIFLLIVSPFLALILPFIFVRNTGSIWIGEFFRWLFYGPLLALFLAALAKIWKAGIPYEFDFDRAQAGEMVYSTGINILYGGPAQALSPTNTSNYADTYAEYVIGIIMLWTCILLPWLLLRIFRDYCCDILERNGAILSQILDRVRNFTPPPPPAGVTPGPTSNFGKNIDLPFRNITNERKTVSIQEHVTRERIIEKIREKDISSVNTREIQRAFDLNVSSLRDIARLETKKSSAASVKSTLESISNPLRVNNMADRQAFESLRSELTHRAAMGDQVAKSMIQAATSNVSKVPQVTTAIPNAALKEAIEKPGVPVILPGTRIASEPIMAPATTMRIAGKTNIASDKVEQVLKAIPLAKGVSEEEKIETIAEKTHTTPAQVKKILDNVPDDQDGKPAGPAPVTIEEYEEVRRMWMNHYRNTDVPVSESIKTRNAWIDEDIKQLTNTINLLASSSVKDRQHGMENVATLLPFLLLGGFTDLETLTYVKAKLEAARLVAEEIAHVDKARAEAKNEEELVSIPVIERTEEKEMTLDGQKQMDIPEENTDKKDEKESELPDFSDDDDHGETQNVDVNRNIEEVPEKQQEIPSSPAANNPRENEEPKKA